MSSLLEKCEMSKTVWCGPGLIRIRKGLCRSMKHVAWNKWRWQMS